MDLSRLQFRADGVAIAIYAGDIPAEALMHPAFPEHMPEDAVVIVVRHWGRFVARLIVKREDSADAHELIQATLDQIGEQENPSDPDHPSGPRLVP